MNSIGCLNQASLSKENETQSKAAIDLEVKAKELETSKSSLEKQLDKEKQTNAQSQVRGNPLMETPKILSGVVSSYIGQI